ncbi:hypothetical protein PLESTM_001105600 [Pleodorina starrii]|nr:hypothetical protein PLESTM_001105600 [Pleodorina starrii]
MPVKEFSASRSVQSLDKQLAELRAEVDDLECRVAVVESEAAEFRKVVLHYVTGKVHKKIQSLFGPKAQGQQWNDYLVDTFSRQRSWFEQNKLGFAELDLLSKGPDTPPGRDQYVSPLGVEARIVAVCREVATTYRPAQEDAFQKEKAKWVYIYT